MWRLINPLKNPPGSFPYDQTEGIPKSFKPKATIADQAKAVADFRAGNGLPRASVAEATEDIDAFQCQRLGNNPRFCFNTEGETYVPVNQPQTSGCKTCNGRT